jgi:hypothetical protein
VPAILKYRSFKNYDKQRVNEVHPAPVAGLQRHIAAIFWPVNHLFSVGVQPHFDTMFTSVGAGTNCLP